MAVKGAHIICNIWTHPELLNKSPHNLFWAKQRSNMKGSEALLQQIHTHTKYRRAVRRPTCIASAPTSVHTITFERQYNAWCHQTLDRASLNYICIWPSDELRIYVEMTANSHSLWHPLGSQTQRLELVQFQQFPCWQLCAKECVLATVWGKCMVNLSHSISLSPPPHTTYWCSDSYICMVFIKEYPQDIHMVPLSSIMDRCLTVL